MKLGPVHCYFINDNRKPGGRDGRLIRNGRFFLHFGEFMVLSWEWNLWSRSCGTEVQVGMADTYQVMSHVALPPVSLFFTVESHKLFGWLFRRLIPDYGKRCTGVAVHDGSIWFDVWSKWGEWSAKDPWWMQFNINPVDVIFGKPAYSERTIKEGIPVEVPMPEKSYPGTVKIFESIWKRPRSPFSTRIVRTTIEVPEGVPFPGKGENSWDCGEDSYSASTSQETTAYGAVAGLVRDVLSRRERDGGKNWRPKEALAKG